MGQFHTGSILFQQFFFKTFLIRSAAGSPPRYSVLFLQSFRSISAVPAITSSSSRASNTETSLESTTWKTVTSAPEDCGRSYWCCCQAGKVTINYHSPFERQPFPSSRLWLFSEHSSLLSYSRVIIFTPSSLEPSMM